MVAVAATQEGTCAIFISLDNRTVSALLDHQVRVLIDGTIFQCAASHNKAHGWDVSKVQSGVEDFFLTNGQLWNVDAFDLFKFKAHERGVV